MGPRQSPPSTTATNMEVQGETNLKLKAQKIKDFTGGHEDWPNWKSQTKCAFSGSGYERVLKDLEYAMANERLNKVVYTQLAAATVEGVAYHLVSKVEETKNGHSAWRNLVEWYDGDMILNETAENLQNKLDNLTGSTQESQQASTSTNSWLGFGIWKKSRVKDYHLDMPFIYF
jgi:hypothetical protein